MITDNKGIERYSVSTKRYNILQKIKRIIQEDESEFWIAYIGETGVGKSLTAQYDAMVIDPSIEGQDKRACFTKEEFIKQCVQSKKQVVIGDEAVSLFFNRASMTKEGREISELSNQIRQKNLCIMLCIPDITALDKQIIKKLKMVVFVWETKEKQPNGTMKTIKGNAGYYPDLKGHMFKTKFVKYLQLKDRYPLKFIKRPNPMFREKGSPNKENAYHPLGIKQYKEKKENILAKYMIDPEEAKTKQKENERNNAILNLYYNEGLSTRKIAKVYGKSQSLIAEIIKKNNPMNEQAGKITNQCGGDNPK